jgi:hypothetical protein
MPNATIVGKHMDSKKSTMKSMEMPVLPRSVIDGMMKMMHLEIG